MTSRAPAVSERQRLSGLLRDTAQDLVDVRDELDGVDPELAAAVHRAVMRVMSAAMVLACEDTFKLD